MQKHSDFERSHYLFGREQILRCDLRPFLWLYDPRRLNALQLRVLFGRLTIELEDAEAMGDIATIPEGRALIHAVHHQWPWAGFFLDLTRPIGPKEALGSLPILAYGLCTVDLELAAWDRTGECHLRVNQGQLWKFRAECYAAIESLGVSAEIPIEVLQGRKTAVAKQLKQLIEDP